MKRRGPAPTVPCGTRSAYKRHHRNKEIPCEACKAAHAEWHRRYRAARLARG